MALDYQALLAIAHQANTDGQPCPCSMRLPLGWASLPLALREEQLEWIGRLAEFEEEDATLDEYHPHGTYYWSDHAPIAPRYYPYNQCALWRCKACQRAFLRYNDDGAYHSEARIRLLSSLLLVDAPHPFDGRHRAEP